MDFFLCVVGMVMIVEGLPYFMRKFGFVLMLAGLFLVFIGKR